MKTKQTTLADSSTVVHELPRSDVQITESKLQEWYIDQRKSMGEIADELDISQSSALRLLNWAGIERRSVYEANKERREEIQSREYADPDNLRELHHNQDKSIAEIARKYDMVDNGIKYWFNKHDIEVKNHYYEIPEWKMSPPNTFPYYGYPVWMGCDGETFPVHRLLVIAEGADPHKVFNEDYNVHHKNNHTIDNRPSNLELLELTEHGNRGNRNAIDRRKQYTQDDMKAVVNFMLNPSKYIAD